MDAVRNRPSLREPEEGSHHRRDGLPAGLVRRKQFVPKFPSGPAKGGHQHSPPRLLERQGVQQVTEKTPESGYPWFLSCPPRCISCVTSAAIWSLCALGFSLIIVPTVRR